MLNDKSVCAIVVTYNRLELLIECLNQLLKQTMPLTEVILIDNASTDDTVITIKKMFPTVKIVQLPQNVGGAGGFYEGIKLAYERGHDWLWVLDDDTIAREDSLEQLITSYNKFSHDNKPTLLASKVVWSDDTLHPMNIPQINYRNHKNLFVAAENQCVNLRSASFVSILINRNAISNYGFPLKEYFIWNDDVEYTSRILKQEFGVLCPKSIVLHKTKSKYTPLESSGNRYFFEIRNKLWLLRTNSFYKKEKIKILYSISIGVLKYLKINKLHPSSIAIIIKGLYSGIFNYRNI